MTILDCDASRNVFIWRASGNTTQDYHLKSAPLGMPVGNLHHVAVGSLKHGVHFRL